LKRKSVAVLGRYVLDKPANGEIAMREVKAKWKAPGTRNTITYLIKGKAVPLHAMEALGGRGGIAATHSRPRH